MFLILVILLQLFQLPKKIERYIKEMKIIFSLFKILATALPSLRISPLLAFVLVGTGTLLFNVMDIQSIGSGLTSFGDLFNNFLFTQSSIGLEEISLLLFSSLVPIKPKRLTKTEKESFSLSQELKNILILFSSSIDELKAD